MNQRNRPSRPAIQQEAGSRVHEAVELKLAPDGAGLWLAIEAAQFARILLHEEPDTGAEEHAMSEFVEAFARYTEVWEDTASQTKAAFLDTLSHHLQALKDLGLFVHWASVDRMLTDPGGRTRLISLAILNVGRTSATTMHVAIPRDLEITEEEPEEDE